MSLESPRKTAAASPSNAVSLGAISLTLVWVAGLFAFMALHPKGGLDLSRWESIYVPLFIFVLVFPIAFLWWALALKVKLESLFQDFAQLNRKVETARKTGSHYNSLGTVVGNSRAEDAAPAGQAGQVLDDVQNAIRKVEKMVAELQATRETQVLLKKRAMKVDDEALQPKLALGTPSDDLTLPLLNSELISALNFPDNEKDARGFAALRRARQDNMAKTVLQSSQDLLTLLSQDGVYMDDLHLDRAQPDVWRRFARGERGASVMVLGGIRDRSSLALSMGRLREDPDFRDAAHHFLREFDLVLQKFEPHARDDEMMAFANTRSARAFMLLGRATGAFG